jgi:hypothetical protein
MEVAANSSFLTTDLDMAELDDLVAGAGNGDGTATTNTAGISIKRRRR